MIRLKLFCSVLLPLLCHAKESYPVLGTYLQNKISSSDIDKSYILPKNLKPISYNLSLCPFLENATFKGKVDIVFLVLNLTDTIVINLNNDSIDTSSMTVNVLSDEKVISVINMTLAVPQQMIFFKLGATLTIGKSYKISISYKGLLRQDMRGFYFSEYNTTSSNSSGTTVTNHRMAVTQFESTAARMAFPCFDEPAYRARFTISILRTVNYTSVSNMPLDSTSKDAETGWMLDKFKTTPLMPTYLVAFIVSDLSNITDKQVRVFARKEVIQEGTYALSVSQPILEKIGNFVGGIPYSLDKIDVAAIPDFDAGAMENWGLTTYREKYVLYNPRVNSWRDKYNVLAVIAHEFGHQWFGDLVTPQWWDYTWLNEAFARYFEFTIPNQIEPSWKIGSTMFVMMGVQDALGRDTGNPRPMTAPVYTPEQIEGVFDYVIYQKGASVLRMIENFMTTPAWRSGLKEYIKANAYGTGTPEKLFSALQNAVVSAGLEVPYMNETLIQWTTQPGYPLIEVNCIMSSLSNNNITFNITQGPFDQANNSSHLLWNVPLTYATYNQTDSSTHWLLPSLPNTSFLTVNTPSWVIFNCDQVGFYRVKYDLFMLEKLVEQLNNNHTAIKSANRAQLLDDAFHLARTGHVSYATAFKLTFYLSHDKSLLPWNAFINSLRHLINLFSGTATGDQLKQYCRGIIAEQFQALVANFNQPSTTLADSLKTQILAQFSCEVESPQCQYMAVRMFQSWRGNTTGYWISPEIKVTVLCFGLKGTSTLSSFLDVFTLYLKSNNGAEKLGILEAMGCLSNADLVAIYLGLVTDEYSNYVRRQERWIAFLYLARGQASVMPTLSYIVQNYNKTTAAVGSRLGSVLGAIGQTLSKTSHIDKVKQMVNDTQLDPSLRAALNSSVLSAVIKRAAWTSTPQAESLKSWIARQTSSASSTRFTPLLLIAIFTLYMATNSRV